MNVGQASEAIAEQFVGAWTASQPTVPIALDDEAFSPPSPAAPWVRLAIRHSTAQQATLGPPGQRRILNAGRIYVSVFGPINIGKATLYALAESARAALALRTIASITGEPVTTYARAINEMPSSDGWSMLNVVVPFDWYETETPQTAQGYGMPIVVRTNADVGALTLGMPVYASAAGAVDKAIATALATARAVGLVADATIASGASGNIQTGGTLVAQSSAQWDAITGDVGGLVTNAPYYVDVTAGKLTRTAPAIVSGFCVAPIGFGLDVLTMNINIAPVVSP